MPNFYTKFGSIVNAEQWFPDRPVTGVRQPLSCSVNRFKPYITLKNFVCGEITVEVAPGDWILIADKDETFAVKDHTFKAMHKPADDEAAKYLGFSSLADYESKFPTK